MPEALRIALAHNLKRLAPSAGGSDDDEAEYDSPSTIAAIHAAIASYGHHVVDLEADATFARALLEARVDLVFNVAEGRRGRGREAQVPALLELLGIPYTGSDPACMVVTLDKALAKAVVRQAGIRTPRGVVMNTGEELLPSDMQFPVIVKPVAEGSSKGVLPSSIAKDEQGARALARSMVTRYRQGALVEEYLPGREFTVGIVGHQPSVFAPLEIILPAADEYPVYSFDHKLAPTPQVRYEVPAKISAELDRELRAAALAVFRAVGCRDVARIDLRLDRDGRPSFIECNPLPGLTPGWSDLCLVAEGEGTDYRTLIGQILAPAMARAKSDRPSSRSAAGVAADAYAE